MSNPALPDWPRAISEDNGSEYEASGRIRCCPEDFQVDEELGFSPDGDGEHVFLLVRKRNRNTDQIARLFARHAGVRARDVGYCGLKDRIAITTQWFSVWLPGKDGPDWSLIEDEDLQVLEQSRHLRKLQRGALQANRFTVILRNIRGTQSNIEKRLELIKQQGVPNYFGEQRFGRGGGNISAAKTMFEGKKIKDRHLRGLYLSAARSFLFNEVLAERVRRENWNKILPGEVVMLAGSRSYFVSDEVNEEINGRLEKDDIHPSGPLWGKGELISQDEAGKLEQVVLAPQFLFCEGLEKAGLKQERRALRLLIKDLRWIWLGEKEGLDLQLNFSLPAGAYATAVLREVASLA